MATIEPYELKSGKRYMVKYRTPDRQQTTKRGFRTKRDAEQWLNKMEYEKSTGQFIHPMAGKVTVGELGPEWLARKKHLKPSSLQPLKSAWRNHVEPVWGDRQISSIRHTEVQAWTTELHHGDEANGVPAKSATVVIRAYGILSGILDDAVKDNLLSRNPADGVEMPKKQKSPNVYLTHEQVHRLAGESAHPDIVLILSYCGLRWGELAALRVKDVNQLKRRLEISRNAVKVGGDFHVGTPKTSEIRSVSYPKFLDQYIRAACAGKHPDDLLFTNDEGKFLTAPKVYEGSRSWLTGALRRAKLPMLTPHDFRHTAASLAVQAGANVKAVQRLLGHKSAAMTLDVYADLFDSDLDDVAEALDHAVSQMNVVKTWSKEDSRNEESSHIVGIATK